MEHMTGSNEGEKINYIVVYYQLPCDAGAKAAKSLDEEINHSRVSRVKKMRCIGRIRPKQGVKQLKDLVLSKIIEKKSKAQEEKDNGIHAYRAHYTETSSQYMSSLWYSSSMPKLIPCEEPVVEERIHKRMHVEDNALTADVEEMVVVKQAVRYGFLDCTKLLLQYGADCQSLNLRSSYQNSLDEELNDGLHEHILGRNLKLEKSDNHITKTQPIWLQYVGRPLSGRPTPLLVDQTEVLRVQEIAFEQAWSTRRGFGWPGR